jgi:hypothetical protein
MRDPFLPIMIGHSRLERRRSERKEEVMDARQEETTVIFDSECPKVVDRFHPFR